MSTLLADVNQVDNGPVQNVNQDITLPSGATKIFVTIGSTVTSLNSITFDSNAMTEVVNEGGSAHVYYYDHDASPGTFNTAIQYNAGEISGWGVFGLSGVAEGVAYDSDAFQGDGASGFNYSLNIPTGGGFVIAAESTGDPDTRTSPFLTTYYDISPTSSGAYAHGGDIFTVGDAQTISTIGGAQANGDGAAGVWELLPGGAGSPIFWYFNNWKKKNGLFQPKDKGLGIYNRTAPQGI